MTTLNINGESRKVNSGETLADLLTAMELNPERVVVAVNGKIVELAELKNFILNDGDNLELMSFVGGG